MKLCWRSILEIHVYAGLFCLPYLLIFGLSSLDFNHHFLSTKALLDSSSRETVLSISPEDDLEAFSSILADSLDLMGWYLPWDSWQDSSRTVITYSQPGKTYGVTLFPDGRIIIEEEVTSFGDLMKIMHFLGEEIPNAPWWVQAWKYYQSLTVYALILWVFSGIYLWMRKKKRPKIETALMWGIGSLSLLFILYLWLNV